MKKLLLLISLIAVSCSSNPESDSNLELAQKWVQAFETGDIELWKEVVSKDVQDVSPMYGMGRVGYDASFQVADFYVKNYTDVKFNDPVWLPGIDTLTMKPDGSVRAYGRWSGVSKSTGREFSLMSYHNFDFEDGKINALGEYFDATGMVNAVGPAQRNVVVFTAKVSKKNLNKFQELMDSDDGLTVTRNADGCTHLEAFYNEENQTYFIYEYWDSYEQYETYLNWRFNEDPSELVAKAIPFVTGGENGMKAHFNNTNYKFF
jgi:ketosteroid isomerase-like protein/quinol monooxygenase YgiN